MQREETPARRLVSPEYRSKCMDWAVKVANVGEDPGKVVAAATAFYKFVYGEDK